jgi:hypothetical protein
MPSPIVAERPGFVPASPAAVLTPVTMSAPGAIEAVMSPITVRGEPRVPMAAAHVAGPAIKATASAETMIATAVPTATATMATTAVIATLC